MNEPNVLELFTSDLLSLCRRYRVTLSYSSRDECLTITPTEDGGIDDDVEFREPPKPYVPPPPTPEELARTAERESLAAASRETWEAGFKPAAPARDSFPGTEGDGMSFMAPEELGDFDDGYIPGDMFVLPRAKR